MTINNIEITNIQKTIIEGCLLGDGWLTLLGRSKNPHFGYCSKYKDHVNFVFEKLKNLCNYDELKFRSNFDKRTNKTYSKYYFKTKCLPELLPIYINWYKNQVKNNIPNDLILDNIKCLFWYIGDGGFSGNNIQLSTHCFDKLELQNKIIPQLSKFEPKIYLDDSKPIIIIPRINVKSFLNYIGPCPIHSYEYKWNVVEYKNKKFQTKLNKITQEKVKTFSDLYNTGTCVAKISEMYNIPEYTVRYHLIKNKTYSVGKDKYKYKLTEEQIKIIINMRKCGVKWKDITEKFKIKRPLLIYYIKTLDKM
jgi:hypothetical protein